MKRLLKGAGLAAVLFVAAALFLSPNLASQVVNAVRDRLGSDIASAGTLNLNNCSGDVCDVTGTATVTSVTLAPGRQRVVRFTGIATLSGSSTFILPLAANIITTAAGDYAVFRGYNSSVVRVEDYQKKDGTAVYVAAGYTDPLTTRGDLVTRSASATTRLAISGANTILKSDGTDTVWGTVTNLLDSLGSTQGDILYRNATSWAILPQSTSGHRLTTQGSGQNPIWSALPAAASTGFTLGTYTATTSGTSFNFGSIPAGTKLIIISFQGVSLSGTDDLLIQIGDAGGIETSGYVAASVLGVDDNTSTAGFIIHAGEAVDIFTGQMILSLLDSTTFYWVSSHTGRSSPSAGAINVSGGGYKALSAELTQLTLTRTGTDTFDAGSVNIMYQ